jgi:hypothetical protein
MPEHDNQPARSVPGEVGLSRWIQVPVGIAVALFVLFCAFAVASSLLFPGKYVPSPKLAIVVGLILLLACLWVLEKCFRLVTGRKSAGGLLSPTSLRVVAFLLLIIPIAGLFTGYYNEIGSVAIFQAVMYLSGFFGLRALARKREATLDEQAKSKETET